MGTRASAVLAAAAVAACGSGSGGDDAGAAAPGGPAAEPKAAAVELDVDRVDAVRYVLDRPALLAAVVEAVAGGVTATKVDAGYRLDGIGIRGPLLRLGLLDGDVITAVDGVTLDAPLAVREAYAGLGDATSLDVTVARAGTRVTRRYFVRDRLGDALPPDEVFADQPEPLASYTALLEGVRGGVRTVAPERVEVDRAVLDVLAGSPDLLDTARLVSPTRPFRRPRRGAETTLFVGAEPSIFTVLGLTPWDEILAVDGEDFLGSYDFPIKILERVRSGRFAISVRRLGEPLVIRYDVVSGRADAGDLQELAMAWRAEGAASEPDFDDPFAAGGSPGLRAASPVDYAAGIERLSDTRYRIEPDIWDALSDDPSSALTGGSLIRPEVRGGDMIGLRVQSVAPGSFHDAMGLRDGDLVTAIAGVTLENFDEGDTVMELFEALSGTTSFEVAFERGGAARTHTYEIR